MNNPEVLNFFLNVDGDYERLISDLRKTLADHPEQPNYLARYGPWLEEHPLLPMQIHPKQPARWIHVHLIVEDEDGAGIKMTTIALRDDNVYFLGFKNRNGDWYEFGLEGKSAHFLPGSTLLGCDVSYGALAGSGGLVSLDLGKEAMERAVLRLWAYQQHVGPADAATRRDLARLCFMICEAARMVPHFESVGGDGWSAGSIIMQDHVNYAHTWSKMSRALISCALEDYEELSTLNEFNVVYLLLNSPLSPGRSVGRWWHQLELPPAPGGGGSSQQGPGSSNPHMSSSSGPASSGSGVGGGTQQQQQQQGSTTRSTVGKSAVRGRPLVELLDVMLYEHALVGTIVVYDGKRGQIIYKQSQQPVERYEPLALTGPYKAISAEGNFVIQVYDGNVLGTDTSDESTKSVLGEMFWDCYVDDVVYDEVQARDIISTGTSQRALGNVSYVVWSDAVEATVEVNLLLPAGITHVYGKITTRCLPLRQWRCQVFLFSRGRDEKVELVTSGGADSMVPLELGRSVIAVPVQSRYSHVRIFVELHVAHPNKEGDVLLEGDIYFYLDKRTGEIRIEQQGGIFVPVGWAGVSDPKGSGASHGSSQGTASSPSGQGTEQTSEQQVKVQVNMSSPGFHLSPLKPDRDWRLGMD